MNHMFLTRGGAQTIDKVFLLSLKEAKQLFGGNSSRSNGAYWWLRSPGNEQSVAAVVDGYGRLDSIGYGVSQSLGVRPVMLIELNA